jgi:two-component system, NtrC family, nitrogen regulation sensor histidine kinase NtrY
MGFSLRFTLGLIGWIAALCGAALLFATALWTPNLAMARLLAAVLLAGATWGLWRHVDRTNRTIARFVETLRHGDLTARFSKDGGTGFDRLGEALDVAVRRLQAERDTGQRELRFLEALVDDTPVALLTVSAEAGVRPANKAARRLFARHDGVAAESFAIYGATFAERLARPAVGGELMLLRLGSGLERAIVRTATLERLGLPVHAVTVEPVQGTLDAVEMATQTELVRVLTHEILNSLTPVTSLSGTAEALLEGDSPDVEAARVAIGTLSRRAEGLRRFIDSYRAVAKPLAPRLQHFAAAPFVEELARLFAAEWPAHRLDCTVASGLVLHADPDLLAQALINLLRNAAQATREAEAPHVALRIGRDGTRIVVDVEDNGPGIPEALRRDIFLPFFTTRREGSGVGLNLVRQIVVASGWTIAVEDSSLGGTRFRIVMA